MSEQLNMALPEPSTWTRPKGRNTCGRDPEAGPGTCWWWWEGCPNAEKKSCYQRWFHSQKQPSDMSDQNRSETSDKKSEKMSDEA